MFKRFLAAGLLSGLMALGLAVAAPWWTMFQMYSAARDGNAAEFNKRVDYVKVRESLKEQMRVVYEQRAPSTPDFPIGAAQVAVLKRVADQAVEVLVRPETVMQLMRAGSLAKHVQGAPTKPQEGAERKSKHSDVEWHSTYDSTSVFTMHVNHRQRPEEELRFRFHRTALFTWVLSEIEVPLGGKQAATTSTQD